MRQAASWLIALLIAGCGRAASNPALLPSSPQLATPAPTAPRLGEAPADPEAAAQKANPEAWATLAQIKQAGGLVGDLSGLIPDAEASYQTQIVPDTTQADAEARAHHWASDARQAYVGWGFWKVSLLGQTRHTYYSEKLHKCLRMDYSLIKRSIKAYESDGASMAKGFYVLRDSYDNHAYTAHDAYSRARAAGYRPGKYAMAILFNLVLAGPVWVFLDDRSMRPTMAVDANSGEAFSSGLEWLAIEYLVGEGDESKQPPDYWKPITPPSAD